MLNLLDLKILLFYEQGMMTLLHVILIFHLFLQSNLDQSQVILQLFDFLRQFETLLSETFSVKTRYTLCTPWKNCKVNDKQVLDIFLYLMRCKR